jgi:hypothetical protein
MDENTKPETPKPIGPPMPICPYCLINPCIPDLVRAKFGTYLGCMFICPNPECLKLFNVELVGEEPKRIVRP